MDTNKIDFNFDNTARVKAESNYLTSIKYLENELNKSQKDCNKRNAEHETSKIKDGSKWIDLRWNNNKFTVKYDLIQGQFFCTYDNGFTTYKYENDLKNGRYKLT